MYSWKKILGDFFTNYIYFIASEPWPTDVQLYQPFEVEQVLLPDNANILTVQAFLNMSNLGDIYVPNWWVEFMDNPWLFLVLKIKIQHLLIEIENNL